MNSISLGCTISGTSYGLSYLPRSNTRAGRPWGANYFYQVPVKDDTPRRRVSMPRLHPDRKGALSVSQNTVYASDSRTLRNSHGPFHQFSNATPDSRKTLVCFLVSRSSEIIERLTGNRAVSVGDPPTWVYASRWKERPSSLGIWGGIGRASLVLSRPAPTS